MANIVYVFSSPKNTTVEPRSIITLSISPGTTATASEFRWKVSSAASFSAAVAGGADCSYDLPANTWARDQIMVWQARYQDSGGWSDWSSFTVDTSGWISFADTSSAASTVDVGALGAPGVWQGRVLVTDAPGPIWKASGNTSFIIHDSRVLVKDSNGRWKGIPVSSFISGAWKVIKAE